MSHRPPSAISTHRDREPVAQFKIPRLRIIWRPKGEATTNWHWGLCAYHGKGTPRRLHITISLHGLLRLGSACIVVLYFTGAFLLARHWAQNPHNHVTYSDLILPTHWGSVRSKRGQTFIDQGIHEIRAGKYSGVILLNRGVALKPDDQRGRLALAEIYALLGYAHRSLELLRGGLAYGLPFKTYREGLFRLAEFLQDHEAIIQIADQLAALLPAEDHSTRRWLIGKKVQALEQLGRRTEIVEIHQQLRSHPLIAVECAWARTLIANHEAEKALEALQANPESFGLPVDRLRLQIAAAIANANPSLARSALSEWQLLNPNNPAPYAEEILTLQRFGASSEAKKKLGRFFLQFASDPQSVVLLLNRLYETGQFALLDAVQDEAHHSGITDLQVRIHVIQALLACGRIEEAGHEFQEVSTELHSTGEMSAPWVSGTKLLLAALQGNSPSSRSQILDYCTRARLRPQGFEFFVRCLRAAKRVELADDICAIAKNRYPAIPLDPEPAALPLKPLDSPRSATAGPHDVTIQAELRTVDHALETGDLDNARVILRRIASHDLGDWSEQVLLRRIKVHGLLREQASLTATLRLYFQEKSMRQSALHELVTAWNREPWKESALTVCRETAQRFPQAKWAFLMQKEIENDLLVAPAQITKSAEPKND